MQKTRQLEVPDARDEPVSGSKDAPFRARASEKIRAILSAPAAPWSIIGLALLLTSPSLATGLGIDDYLHKLMLRSPPGINGLSYRPFDLFAFATGDVDASH